MERKRILGIFGSILLLAGVFIPMIKVSIVGDVDYSTSYFDQGKFEGLIVAALAVISLILAFTKRFWLLWLSGLASAGTMGYTFVQIGKRISSILSKSQKVLGHRVTDSISDKIEHHTHIQWGLALLIIGVILIIVAAALPKAKKIIQSN